MRLRTLLGLLAGVAALSAVACGDDPAGSTSSAGGDKGNAGKTSNAGSYFGGGTLNAGSGGSLNAGDGGSLNASGGVSPEGGSSTAAGAPSAGSGNAGETTGGEGGAGDSSCVFGLDEKSTACCDFPVTVAMEQTLSNMPKGATLCYNDQGGDYGCRLTTNNSHDPPNPCFDDSLFFAETAEDHTVYMTQGWVFLSASAGTINAQYKNFLEQVPTGTEITVTVRSRFNQILVAVFTFEEAGQFTLTSFAPAP